MIEKKNFAGKPPIIMKILRVVVMLGWISFLFYNLYLVRYLGNECNRNPANCAFLEERPAATSLELPDGNMIAATDPYGSPAWMQEASLKEDCKPLAFANDLFFQKVYPFLKLSGLLIVLTLFSRLDPEEIKRLGSKLKKFSERSEHG